MQCLGSTNWLTSKQYFKALSFLSMASAWRGACSCQVPRRPWKPFASSNTYTSFRGRCERNASPYHHYKPIFLCGVMHFNHMEADRLRSHPQPPWLNEHTRYPGGASVRAGRGQKRLLLRLAFWNPFKTVNELCYYLKTPSWILCTPHHGG